MKWSYSQATQKSIVFDLVTNSFEGDFGFGLDDASTSVAGVGDINGDGIADMASVVSLLEGVRVFLGSPTQTLDSMFDIFSSEGLTWLEVEALAAGDINNDGLDDMLIITQEVPTPGHGTIYVVYGDDAFKAGGSLDLNNLDGTNGFILGRNRGSLFAGPAGDFNGDGIDDLAVAAYDSEEDFSEAYVVFGSATISATRELDLLSLSSDGLRWSGFRGHANTYLGELQWRRSNSMGER